MTKLVYTVKNLSDREVLFILIFTAGFTSLLSGLLNTILKGSLTFAWWEGWLQNFSTEMFGGIMTFVLFMQVIEARRRQEDTNREEERVWQDLLRRLRSHDHATALIALDELGSGRLRYGALQDANLRGANLSGADLKEAYLSGVGLKAANLSGVDLGAANLSDANLRGANLSGVDLGAANLSDANLRGANLSGANLWAANLSGATDLKTATFDVQTVLPDTEIIYDKEGKFIYRHNWSPDTDMTRYTDPNHPDFWQPEWAKEEQSE